MAISRNQIEALYIPYIHAVWDSGQTHMITQEYKELFEMTKARFAVEEEAAVTGFIQAPQKSEGAPFNYDTATQLYISRYIITTFALGFEVTQEAIEDAVAFRIVERLTPSLKKSMSVTKETIGANVLNNGFNAGFPGGDGVSLFNNAHPTASAPQSNVLPTPADLSYTSLWDLIVQINQALDDKGKISPLIATKLVVPPSLYREAETILKSPGAPGTADNDINAILTAGLVREGYCVNHYLTNPTAWFVKTDAVDGLKLFEKIPLSMETTLPNYNTGNIAVKARERYAFGWSNWRGVYGTPGV